MFRSGIIICLFAICGFAKNLPFSFTACKSTGTECLRSSIESALKELKNGKPEIGVSSIDPMEVSTLTIGEGTGAVHLVQNYADLKITGFSDVTVKDVSLDDSTKTLQFTTYHPKLIQSGNYDINGKILVLPVFGKGHSAITLDGATLTHTIQFEETAKDDKRYYTPKEYNVKITIEKAHYQFDNLFDGNKALSDNVLTLINDEWKAIFEDVTPGIQNSYAAIFMSFAKRVFSKIPVDEIFQ